MFLKGPTILPAWHHAHFFLNELPIPGGTSEKIFLGLNAVTGLEHKFAHETIMRECVKTLTQDTFIPPPLITLLLS